MMLSKVSKNKWKISLFFAVLFLPMMVVAAPTHFYLKVQGGFGSGNFEKNSSQINLKGNTYTWRGAGGVLWNTCGAPWQYGIETGFMGFPRFPVYTDDFWVVGRPVHEKGTISGYSIDIAGVTKYNFNCQFNAYSKLGFAYLRLAEDATTKFNDGTVESRFHKAIDTVAPEVALGIGYKIKQNLEVNLDFNAIFASNLGYNNITKTVGGLTAGLTYYFS